MTLDDDPKIGPLGELRVTNPQATGTPTHRHSGLLSQRIYGAGSKVPIAKRRTKFRRPSALLSVPTPHCV